MIAEITQVVKRRSEAIKRLHKGLTEGGITDPIRVLSIVTAFMAVEELESLAELQDRGAR